MTLERTYQLSLAEGESEEEYRRESCSDETDQFMECIDAAHECCSSHRYFPYCETKCDRQRLLALQLAEEKNNLKVK